jgi:hypothetical protein
MADTPCASTEIQLRLERLRAGDEAARGELLEIAYERLSRIRAALRERPGEIGVLHTAKRAEVELRVCSERVGSRLVWRTLPTDSRPRPTTLESASWNRLSIADAAADVIDQRVVDVVPALERFDGEAAAAFLEAAGRTVITAAAVPRHRHAKDPSGCADAERGVGGSGPDLFALAGRTFSPGTGRPSPEWKCTVGATRRFRLYPGIVIRRRGRISSPKNSTAAGPPALVPLETRGLRKCRSGPLCRAGGRGTV